METLNPVRWIAACGVAVLTACAPDALRNDQASGFNDYLSAVEHRCQPLWFGQMQLQKFDVASAGARQSDFASLLDSASRLYYQRITAAQFRESVQGIAMSAADARTARSVDCMISQLPADRPSSPAR